MNRERLVLVTFRGREPGGPGLLGMQPRKVSPRSGEALAAGRAVVRVGAGDRIELF